MSIKINRDKDLFGREGQAKSYSKARPVYPEAVLNFTMKNCRSSNTLNLAVDVATGTGQIAINLSPYFNKIVACDISEEQLKNAKRAKNIEYHHASAYEIPVSNQSVDLVTIGQALHWMDEPIFFNEVARCLAPGGTLAILGYGICKLENNPLNDIFRDYYLNTLGSYSSKSNDETNQNLIEETSNPHPFGKHDKNDHTQLDMIKVGQSKNWWDCNRKYLDSAYSGLKLPLPFTNQETFFFEDTKKIQLSSFMEYLSTMSAYRTFCEDQNIDPLIQIAMKMEKSLGSREKSFNLTFPFFCIKAQKK